jgi:ADP-heptose:LPS heptosyltransferase
LVAIFGPGYIKRFDPRNISDRVTVLYRKAGCAPCNKIECAKIECFKKIPPKEAIEASLGFLTRVVDSI